MYKKDIAEAAVGTFLMAVGIVLFFDAHGLVIGGASGLAILISSVFEGVANIRLPLWLLFIIINVPLFGAGFKVLGFKSLKKSFATTLLLSFMMWAVGFLPEVESDLPITAVFGGILEGLGLGLVLRADCTTGGTDLFAVILHRALPSVPVSGLIMWADSVIIGLGFFKFGSVNMFYALVSAYISAKAIDAVVIGAGYAKAVYIISDKWKEIADIIMTRFERGVTTLKGRGEYTGRDKNIILCIVGKRQVSGIKREAFAIDPEAFLIISDAAEVTGEGFSEKKHNLG